MIVCEDVAVTHEAFILSRQERCVSTRTRLFGSFLSIDSGFFAHGSEDNDVC